jgi:D-alanyl-D-alanine carboxypeptidase (penicillin-binding protein 5/6)
MNPAYRPGRLCLTLAACCLFLASGSSGAAAMNGPAPATAPAIAGKAYVLMDYDSGQVLASANAEEALPPASLTKMMTSFLVEQALKSGSLKPTDQVRVSMNAWCHGSSVESCMYLPLDGQASVIDLLRGIVVQSGNDAAKAVAEHMAGSEGGFAQLMNGEATRIGMVHTHFVNSTGLPAADHKSSAHDLALLARAIIHDSADYYPIYAERNFKYNGIKQGNRNALLYTDPSVDGLKTGHTNEAGYCLTASAKRNGLRLISVVMGAPTVQGRADETRALFDWGFGAYEKTRPYPPGTAVATTSVDFGKVDLVPVGIAHDWELTIPRGQPQALQTSLQFNRDIKAPIAKGDVLGNIVATLNGKWFAQEPLVALDSVERAGFMQRAWQHIRRIFK